MSTPVFHWPGRTEKFASGTYTDASSCVGRYTSPVSGLNDIGIQLCAPNPPGRTTAGAPT